MNLLEFLTEEILKNIGLDHLPKEKKEAYKDKLENYIFFKLQNKILDTLSPEEQEAYDTMSENEEALLLYFQKLMSDEKRKHIFEEVILEVANEFK